MDDEVSWYNRSGRFEEEVSRCHSRPKLGPSTMFSSLGVAFTPSLERLAAEEGVRLVPLEEVIASI
jgi:hypothetical protein